MLFRSLSSQAVARTIGVHAKAISLCGERKSQDTAEIFRLRKMQNCILCFDELSAQMCLTSVFGMAASLPAAGGGVKGKRSVGSGRRGTQPHRRQGHSSGTATGNRWTVHRSHSYKRKTPTLRLRFYVRVTYLPGQSPAKYCRRRCA